MRRSFLFFPFICLLCAGGCDLAQPLNQEPHQQELNNLALDNQAELPVAQLEQNDGNAEERTEERPVTVRAETELRERANRNATPLNNPAAIVTVPVRTLTSTRDRLVLQQIEQAMQLFRAEHGRPPAGHAEFMERIIRANNIQLPPLRPGQDYLYEGGELKIRSQG